MPRNENSTVLCHRGKKSRCNGEFFRRLTNGRFLESLVTVKRATRRRPPASVTVLILAEKHSATVWIDYKQTSGSPRRWLHRWSLMKDLGHLDSPAPVYTARLHTTRLPNWGDAQQSVGAWLPSAPSHP